MNTNTQPKVFEWTDELVKEFILKECNKHETWDRAGLELYLDKFIKEKQQPIEERIVVSTFFKCHGMDLSEVYYSFILNGYKSIPEEKYEEVKQAIEKTLNGEMDNPVPTIERQDTKEDNPDWAVLEVEYCGEKRQLRNGQYHIYKDGVGFDFQYIIDNGGKIISVRRKSDNEVLSVDDITSEGKITGFTTFKNIMSVQFQNGLRSCGINVPEKAPKEEQKPVQKPPIGLMPEWLWNEQRFNSVSEAISRYMEAGHSIPSEWIEEKFQLQKKLAKSKTNQ